MSDNQDALKKLIEQKELEAANIEIAQLREQVALKDKLPHLYAFKHYPWSRRVFESRNKEVLLIGANQISKSSIMIRKYIHWATEKSLWPKLWPHLTPNCFLYLYPNKDTATSEFYLKHMQFLPRDRNDPKYGWEAEFERKLIKAVHFKSGVSVYFKTYSQDASDLQGTSAFAVFNDEELPVNLLGELSSRLNATNGYFMMSFTCTLGQDYWRRAMEPLPGEKEEHPNALKVRATLYDCLEYEDGTPSHWTRERINQIELKCPTWTDAQIRVHARFAKAGGRKYEAYDEQKNRSENHPLPKDWSVWAGVDIGSGGETGHPAGIIFVGVDPHFRRGRVFRAWRGDGISTTSGDILVKYVELRGNLKPALQVYDFASAEFRQIAESAGESFVPAEKRHAVGESILNTLFKNQMLSLQLNDPEIDKLSNELCTVLKTTDKKEAHDDLCDALRYIVCKIPWDFAFLDGLPIAPVIESRQETNEDRRRGLVFDDETEKQLIDSELAEWNEHYGS